MKLLRLYSRIPAWILAFFLQGLGLFNLLLSDFLHGLRVPIFCGFVIAVHLPLLLWRPRRDLRGFIVTVLTAAIAIVFGLSLLSTDGTDYGLWKLGVFLAMSFVPVVLLLRFYMGRSDLLMHLLGALLLFSFVSVFQIAQAVRMYGLSMFKWYLLKDGVDVIGMSRAMGIGAVLSVGYVFRCQGVWRKPVAAIVALLMLAGQVGMNERGPLLACVLSLAYLISVHLRLSQSRGNAQRLLMALLVLVALALFAWQLPSLSQRFTMNNLLVDGRVDIYQKAAEDISQMNVLVGLGLGNFSYVGTAGSSRQYLHNIFGEAFLETGLLGLAVLVLYLCAIYRFVFSRNVAVRAIACPILIETKALFVYSALNAQVSGDMGTNFMVWVAGGLALCAVVTSESELSRPVVRMVTSEVQAPFTRVRRSRVHSAGGHASGSGM